MGFFELLIGASASLCATTLGASLVFPLKRLRDDAFAFLLAFAAGVMAFSAIGMFSRALASTTHEAAALAFTAGALAVFALGKLLPHAHAVIRKTELSHTKRKATLVAGIVTLHNVPEGVAIASAFAGSTQLGWLVAASMSLQNIPEGLLVAAPLSVYGVSRRKSFKYAFLSGAAETVAAVTAFFVLSLAALLVPAALAFSAGAMSFLVLSELLPDAVKRRPHAASAVFMAGVATALAIATLLGF
jgi:ZIP family zinc transporter